LFNQYAFQELEHLPYNSPATNENQSGSRITINAAIGKPRLIAAALFIPGRITDAETV
jgi:hypothetical protein